MRYKTLYSEEASTSVNILKFQDYSLVGYDAI
jgi:hypothetical protein